MIETKQEHVLQALCEQYPEIQRIGWKSAVIEAFASEDDQELNKLVKGLPYIPDGYVIDKAEREIIFFEVEVHRPLLDSKLQDYGCFWHCIDFHDIEFALLSVTKHGHINPIDLGFHYANWLKNHVPHAS